MASTNQSGSRDLIDYFQLVVKIQNVQYGKRLYKELNMELRKWVKNGMITTRVDSVAVKFRTESVRDFYTNILHGKKVTLFGKEVDLMVVETQKIRGDPEQTEESKDTSEGDSEDDIKYETHLEGKAEEHVKNTHKNGYADAIEGEAAAAKKSKNPKPGHDTHLRIPGLRSLDWSWTPIEEFGIVNKSSVPEALVNMGMFWLDQITQRNGLSKNAVDLMVDDLRGSIFIKALSKGSKLRLGYFQFQSKQSPRIEFGIGEEPVTDSVPICRSPKHTQEFHGACASLVRAGYTVSLQTSTEIQDFDIREGILGVHHDKKAAQKCTNVFVGVPKCDWCCGTYIRVAERSPMERNSARRKRMDRGIFYACLRSFIDLASSRGINIINKELALPKRHVETPQESNRFLVSPPNQKRTICNSSSPQFGSQSRFTDHVPSQDTIQEPVVSMRPKMPTTVNPLSSSPQTANKPQNPSMRPLPTSTNPLNSYSQATNRPENTSMRPKRPTAASPLNPHPQAANRPEMRSKMPTTADPLNSYPQATNRNENARNVHRPESSLAQELIDRILDKSQKLVESEAQLREALSQIEKDKATASQQQQDLAAASTQLRQKEDTIRDSEQEILKLRQSLADVEDQLKKEKRTAQDNERKISQQRQNLNNVRDQLSKELRDAKDTVWHQRGSLSGALRRVDEDRDASRLADSTMSSQVQELHILKTRLGKAEKALADERKLTTAFENSGLQPEVKALEKEMLAAQQETSKAKQMSEGLKTINKLLNSRTTDLHNQNIAANTSLRDLQADYEIQARNMGQLEHELEIAHQKLRGAGLMGEQQLKREYEAQAGDGVSVKRIKLEKLDS